MTIEIFLDLVLLFYCLYSWGYMAEWLARNSIEPKLMSLFYAITVLVALIVAPAIFPVIAGVEEIKNA